jgi:ferredoxin
MEAGPGCPPEGAPGQPDEAPGARQASEERIVFLPEPCTRLAGDACARCRAVCPVDAIRFGEDGRPAIDDDACTRCGICIGVCDSFASSLITTPDLARRMVRKAEDGRIYLCCKEDVFEGVKPAGNVFVLGCLSAVSPEFLTFLLSTGTEVVLCHDLAYCEGCTAGGRFGGRLWQRAFELAQSWTGRPLKTSDVIPEKRDLATALAAPDRRTLFTGAIGAMGEVASGKYREHSSTTVEDFLARRERMRAKMHTASIEANYLDKSGQARAEQSRFARKRLLEEAIRNDPAIAGRKGTQDD